MNQEETIHVQVLEVDAGIIKAKFKQGRIKRVRVLEKEMNETDQLTEGLKREDAS